MSQTRRLAADLVSINRTYLSKLEKGELSGLEIIAKLATALEIEPAEFASVAALPEELRGSGTPGAEVVPW